MGDQDELSGKIGRIALAQARLDEWLVQVLISLLKPLPEHRVQLLVSDRSLDSKRSLVKQLAGDIGLSLDTPLSSGAVPSQVLSQVGQLNRARDRAIHSYYDSVVNESARRFRSRQSGVEQVSLDDLAALADSLESCGDDLREFVDVLERAAQDQSEIESRWGEIIRGAHEVIVAGHLHERRMLGDMAQEIESNGSIRLALSGARRRILACDESVAAGEYLAEIATSNWLATITSPDGEIIHFGDSGWRDVTALARDEDPEVRQALIRRVGGSVQLSVEGGEMASAPSPQVRDRLEERAFGPGKDPSLKVSDWVLGLEGFAPAPKGATAAVPRAVLTTEDWDRSAELFADLSDPDVMDAAWR